MATSWLGSDGRQKAVPTLSTLAPSQRQGDRQSLVIQGPGTLLGIGGTSQVIKLIVYVHFVLCGLMASRLFERGQWALGAVMLASTCYMAWTMVEAREEEWR